MTGLCDDIDNLKPFKFEEKIKIQFEEEMWSPE